MKRLLFFLMAIIFAIQTMGQITTYPWTETFDGTWATNTPGNSAAPASWININGGSSTTYLWRKGTTASRIKTGTGSAEMYVGGSNPATSTYVHSDWLITPQLALTGGQSLSFYLYSYESTVGNYTQDLSIYIYDVTTNGHDVVSFSDTSLFTVIMPSQILQGSTTANWQEYEINLSQYTGNYRIALVRNTLKGGYYLNIDDLKVDASPICPNTRRLTSTLRSATEVDLNWDIYNNNGSGWQIVYGDTTTFDTLTSTTITLPSTTTMPYTLSNLTPLTSYKFAVRQNCTGQWSNVVASTTPAVATQLPYFTDFENTTDNSNWQFINGTQINKWYIGSAAGVNTTVNGTNGLFISNDNGLTNAHTGGTANLSRVYAYRDFEIPAGTQELALTFDWKANGGVAQNDFLRMYWVPLDLNITAGNIPPSGYDASAQIGNYTGGLGEHWLSKSTVFQSKSLVINTTQFPNLGGRTWRLVVHWRNESSTTASIDPPAVVDNLSLSVITCNAPKNLATSNITSSSVDIAWTSSANAFWLFYKPTSATAYDSLYVNTSSPYTLSNLVSNTPYSYYLKADCVTEVSLPSLSGSFRTACGIINTFPWTEGFEDGAWPSAVAPSNAASPYCWINFNGLNTGSIWRRTTTTSYIKSGSGAAQSYSGSTSNATKLSDWFMTPIMTLTGNQQIRFWAKGYSTYTDSLMVVAFNVSTADITTADTVSNYTVIMPRTKIPADPYTEYELNLSSLIGNYRIGFVVNSNGGGYYLNLDDVKVMDIPTCVRPSNLSFSNPTQNAVDLSWTNGNATNSAWWIYYKSQSTMQWDSVHATSNPFTLTGINASSSYDWYIKTDCGLEQSEASNASSFRTACGVITSIPWGYGFEEDFVAAVSPGNKLAPPCWTVIDRGGVNGTYEYWWKRSTGTASYIHSGTGSAQCYTDYGTSNHNDWLITPQIALTGNELLSFYARRMTSTTSEPDEISVYISTSGLVLDTTNMGIQDTLAGFTRIFNQALPLGDWQKYEVNLSPYTGTYYIAFVRQGTPDGYYLRLDDVLIDFLPQCMKPTQVALNNITATSGEITWVNGRPTDNAWWVYYKSTSSTTWDSVYATSNPYTLTQLSGNTEYNIQIKTDCGGGLLSDAGITTFRTACTAIATFPWTEGFESGAWSSTVAPGNVAAPFCWLNINGLNTASTWRRTTTTAYIKTGSGAAQFYSGSTSNSTKLSDWLMTPIFSLTGNQQIKFWTKGYSTYTDSLMVVAFNVSNGEMVATDTVSNYTVIMPRTKILADPYTEYALNLSSLVGDYRIGFVVNSNGGGYYLNIDEVTVMDIPTCPNTYNLVSSVKSASEVELNWSILNSNGSGWQIVYGDATTFDTLTSTIITLSASDTLPYAIQNLAPLTTYKFAVRQNCGGFWSNIVSSSTPAIAAQLPYVTDFENTVENANWQFINGTQTNKWVIGNATGVNTTTAGTNGLYISNDNGVTNAYTGGTSYVSRVYAYRDFEIPLGTQELALTFDWKAQGGVATTDFLRMYLIPVDLNITAGNNPPGTYDASAQIGNYIGGLGEHWLSQSNVFQTKTMIINTTQFPNLAGRTWRLLVHWRNESSTTSNPPAALDNLSLKVVTCNSPSGVTVSNLTITTADISWTNNSGSSSFWIYYKPSTATIYDSINVTTNPYTLSNLTPNTNYVVYVVSNCPNESSLPSISKSFRTPCVAISSLPYTDSFDTYGTGSTIFPACWTRNTTYADRPYVSTTNFSAPGSLYFYTGSTGSYNIAAAPMIDPSIPINTLRVNFKYRNTNSTDTLRIGVMVDPLDSLTWVEVGKVFSSTTATWGDYEVSLAQYTGTGRYIALRANYGSTYTYAYVDNFVISLIPACAKPTSLVISNITTTAADLSWTNGNPNDASWWLYTKLASATTYDSVLITASSPYTISNLLPSSQYNYYMKTNCPTELSEPTQIYSFRTACGTITTIPYFEDFNSYGTATNTFPSCWTRPILNGNYPSLVTTYNSAPASLRFQSLPAVPTYAVSPALGMDINALRVRFMLRAESLTNSGTMTVGVMSNSTDTTTFEVVKVIQPSNTAFNAYEVEFDSTLLSGSNRFIAFRQNSVVDNWYYWLDDVIIDSIPSCPKPTNLAISNITTTTSDLSWTNGNPNNSSWWLFTKLLSASTYDSVLITSSSPYTISNLSPSSTYNYYMKTDCGAELSESTSVYSFTTVCGAMTIPTPIESFVTVLPTTCWTRFSGQLPTTGSATLSTSTGNWIANAQVTPHNIKVNLYSTSQYYWLVTPSIDLGSGSLSNHIEFDVFLTAYNNANVPNLSSGYADKKFYVLISTDDGLTWTATNTLKKWDNAGSVDTLNKLTNIPLHVAIPLQNVSGIPYSGIVKIAFYGESTVSSVGDNDLHIDNFQVTGQVCAAPTALTASGITQTNATVTWTAGANETSWEVKLGTTGATTMVTSPTYTFTGLTTATQYTAYVRANCGTSNSAWVPVTFTTSSAPIIAVVTTAPVTTFTYNTASFVGSYTTGADTINAVGFEYKTTAATSWTNQTVSPVASPFSYNATGLTPSTQYKVRAYVTKQGGVNVYGDTMTFTTAVLNSPTVTTDPVTNVTGTTATFNGTVAQGTESIVSRGFEYKTNAQAWTSAFEVTATGSTTITANVTGLVTGTNYDVRAYAETATGKTYGSEVSFIAGNPVVLGEVTTLGTTNVDTTSATLNGSVVNVGGATIGIEVGFVYSTTTNPVIDGANVIKVPVTYATGMTNYNSNITGLTDTTQYYVKSYITNSAGTAYGQEMTFITRKSGLNDIDVNSMSVHLYPNPATTEATLVIKGITGKAKIMISDVQGRTINTFEVKSVNGEATKSINVNNFANGVYYVRIQNANTTSTQKLIVK